MYRIKKLRFVDIVVYTGALLTFSGLSMILHLAIGLFNIIFMGVCVVYLKHKSAKPLGMYQLDTFKHPRILLISMLSFGAFYFIYIVYRFHKYPIKVGMTDDDMQAIFKSKSRNKKFRKVVKSVKSDFV